MSGREEGHSATRAGVLRVFLSYRRDDSGGHAGRLYDSLTARLGDEAELFMDVDSIAPGVDFAERIQDAVGRCDVFLAVIGPQWEDARARDGSRRLLDPDDFVRLEIEAAIAHDVRIVPVLVAGAEMPASTELPDSIAVLTRREAAELSDTRWSYDVDRLVRSVGPARSGRRRRWVALGALAAVVAVVAVVAGIVLVTGSTGGGAKTLRSVSFRDQLTSAATGWPVQTTSDCATAFPPDGAGYRVGVSRDEWLCSPEMVGENQFDELVDSHTAVDATLVAATGDVSTRDRTALLGLGCRATASGSYVMSAFADGRVIVARYDRAQENPATLKEVPAPSFGLDQPRRLRFDCIQSGDDVVTLTGWVDGTKVVSVDDRQPLPPGAIQLQVGANIQPAAGEFKKLSVRGTTSKPPRTQKTASPSTVATPPDQTIP